MSLRFLRRFGAPQTTTSNTFCSWNRLPTVMPPIRADAARRTSPGLRPWTRAFSKSTSISIACCSSCCSTFGFLMPSILPSVCRISSCLGAKNAKVLAIDADRDGLILAGQTFAHSLGEERLHLTADARLGTGDRLHRGQRGPVIGLGIQAYPDIGRIHVLPTHATTARVRFARLRREPLVSRGDRGSAPQRCDPSPAGRCQAEPATRRKRRSP